MEHVSDLTYLRRVTSNDPHLMRVFIQSFLNDAPACMKAMSEACENEDWPALKKATHTFKGHVQYMGLAEIVPVIQEVEDNAAAANNTSDLGVKVKRINAVITAAIPELRRALAAL